MDKVLIFSNKLPYRNCIIKPLSTLIIRVSKKCSFLKEEIDFWVLLVGGNGICINPDHIEAMKTWYKLNNLTEVRSNDILLQLFRRFIKRRFINNFSELDSPLINLKKKG